jgi:hypothetical protein
MYQPKWSSGRSLWRSIPLFAFAVSLAFLKLLAIEFAAPQPTLAQSSPGEQPIVESELESVPQREPLSEPTVDPPPQPPMSSQTVLDPLNSPYPVPWNWVLAMLAEPGSVSHPKFRYYRSQSLISPDGQYAAYSRIQMQLSADFTQSRVASVLFLEDLRTGDLRTITASSPFADNPFLSGEPNPTGTIAILIPIAWSETSDRVLAREFESIFGSDIASDFAVVWDRQTNRTHTIAPTVVQYSNAVLLGWSQSNPQQVLFRAGMMGQEDWSMYAVDVQGQTAYASNDQPIIFGQVVNSIWSGPQAHMQP